MRVYVCVYMHTYVRAYTHAQDLLRKKLYILIYIIKKEYLKIINYLNFKNFKKFKIPIYEKPTSGGGSVSYNLNYPI